MKIKILALIAAILCISMLFVACDNTEETTETQEITTEETTVEETTTEEITTAPCETHVDEDANKSCDVCGIAIVYIPELVAPETETRVPMEIAPIPEDVTAEEYINVEYEEIVFGELEENNAGTYFTGGDDVVVYHYEATELEGAYYEVINIYTREVILTVPDVEDVTESFDFNYYYFCVNCDGTDTAKYTNYTYTGNPIGETYEWNSLEIADDRYTFKANTVILDFFNSSNGVYYLIDSEDVVYAMDDMTGEIIYTESRDTLVFRPEFDLVIGDFGYEFDDYTGTLRVYDLTSWIDCIMTYTVPSCYDANVFQLENGNMLIQTIYPVDRYAVSYDVIYYNEKCNIDYVIIDPVAKQVKNVEFGHYISSVEEDVEGLTENAKNVFVINPIKNDRIDTNSYTYVIVDNELNINMDITYFVESNMTLIADGVFYGEVRYNNSTAYVNSIMNADGSIVCTPPVDAFIGYSFIEFENKIYDFGMNLLVDCTEENGYTVFAMESRNFILYKDVELEDGSIEREFYFFNPEINEEPVKMEINDIELYSQEAFVTGKTVVEEDVEKYVYEIRNTNNEIIHTSDVAIIDMYYSNDNIVFVFATGDTLVSMPE